MKKHAIAIGKDAGRLAEDARALLAATADVAGDKIGEIRERLATALKHDKKTYDRIRDRAAAVTKAADMAMHTSPYQAAAIGIGCGVLVGFFVSRRIACHHG